MLVGLILGLVFAVIINAPDLHKFSAAGIIAELILCGGLGALVGLLVQSLI